MAKKWQRAKMYLNGMDYTITQEMDKENRPLFRVYKAWREHGRARNIDHKVQIGKENNFFQALMDITSDATKKPLVMIPTEYLKELQSLKTAQ